MVSIFLHPDLQSGFSSITIGLGASIKVIIDRFFALEGLRNNLSRFFFSGAKFVFLSGRKCREVQMFLLFCRYWNWLFSIYINWSPPDKISIDNFPLSRKLGEIYLYLWSSFSTPAWQKIWRYNCASCFIHNIKFYTPRNDSYVQKRLFFEFPPR